MSKKISHQFQSSREVFELYIPKFKEQSSSDLLIDTEEDSIQSGAKLASELIAKMKKSLEHQI